MAKKAKILIFDIETMWHHGTFFGGRYERNIINFIQYGYMISFAYRWYGEKKVNAIGLHNIKGYKKGRPSEEVKKELVLKIKELFDEADIVVAHNGQAFDVKYVNALCAKYRIQPPVPFKIVDTKLVAKRYFNFPSNKLDDLADFLGIGRKLQTTNGLWDGVERGDKKSWDMMIKYNKQDVVLLEDVYNALKPWMTNHPNLNLFNGTTHNCPICHSTKMQRRGTDPTRAGLKQKWKCMSCGSWHTLPISGNGVIR